MRIPPNLIDRLFDSREEGVPQAGNFPFIEVRTLE
jgi:hypothetical protein